MRGQAVVAWVDGWAWASAACGDLQGDGDCETRKMHVAQWSCVVARADHGSHVKRVTRVVRALQRRPQKLPVGTPGTGAATRCHQGYAAVLTRLPPNMCQM